MTITRTADRIHVTEALSVAFHGGASGARVHLCTSSHFRDGEFLTSAILIDGDTARRLAAALVEMADAAESEAAEVADRIRQTNEMDF